MPRAGPEDKIPWQAVPLAIRARVADVVGSRVARGNRVWGSYGPTPSFRLVLADGRRVFFKGVYAASNEFSRRSIALEERIYREATEFIRGWTPAFQGSFRQHDWHVLLLDDLGPKTVPPWTPALTRVIAQSFADIHRSTLGVPLPEWLARDSRPFGPSWEQIAEETEGFGSIAAAAGSAAEPVQRWLQSALPELERAASTVVGPPSALVHLDARSDNLRLVDGRLYLFDLPNLTVSAPEYDLAELAQSIAVEGGPAPEQVVAWYAERLPVREPALDAAVASLAGFFARRFWEPEIPGLPRLRRFQRDQFRVCLAWAARRLGLAEPEWLAFLVG
jgi:hypothetical protein